MIKNEITALRKKSGKVRGDVLSASLTYIMEKEGKEGVEKIEKELEKYGYPFTLKNSKQFLFYPMQTEVLIALIAKDLLNWTDEDVFEMGVGATRASFIVRMSFPFLVSTSRLFKGTAHFWKKNYNFGELEPVMIDDKKGMAVIKIKGYDVHPISCLYNAGYMVGAARLVFKGDVRIKETKCVHKGDDYHEYIMNWN